MIDLEIIDLDKERIICLVHVDNDDLLSRACFGVPVEAMLRAFIVEDRESGEIRGMWRIKHPDGNKEWYAVKTKKGDRQSQILSLQAALKSVFESAAANAFGISAQVTLYNVPADIYDDQVKTMDWLVEQDIVRVSTVEED